MPLLAFELSELLAVQQANIFQLTLSILQIQFSGGRLDDLGHCTGLYSKRTTLSHSVTEGESA